MSALPCSDTVSRTGVFVAAMTVIEALKTEGMVDVFQVVKALRIQKPGAVPTVVGRHIAIMLCIWQRCLLAMKVKVCTWKCCVVCCVEKTTQTLFLTDPLTPIVSKSYLGSP